MEKYTLILLVLLLASCGTRKTTQTNYEFKSDTLSVNNSLILKQNIALVDLHELRPFDASKPMIIDGKYYYNTIIVYDKSKFDNFEIEQKKELNQGLVFQKENVKETKKTDYTILYLGIFFTLCLFIFLWFKLK